MKYVLVLLITLTLSGFISKESFYIPPPILVDETYTVSEDEHCMALNIYHESRSENIAGKYAVADVVLNRVKDDRWPNTVCEVIHESEMRPSWADPTVMVPKRHRCQFSWFCDGMNDEPKDIDAYNDALVVASQIIKENRYRGITEGATHYHATYVNPNWNKRFQQIGRIGSHIFYRAE